MFTDAELMRVYPDLVRFAVTLVGRNGRQRAEDLAHDAAVKMLAKRSSFECGTNLKSWAFKIAQNCYFDQRELMRNKLETAVDAVPECSAPDNPIKKLELRDTLSLIGKMNGRGTAVLMQALGEDYEYIAIKTKYEVGTIKSRINRARQELADALDGKVVVVEKPKRKRSRRDRLRYNKFYHIENRERILCRQKEYSAQNKERASDRWKSYYARNAERLKERQRQRRREKQMAGLASANQAHS